MAYGVEGKDLALEGLPPVVLQASANQTAPGTGTVVLASANFPLIHANMLVLECVVTAHGGTTPTLDADVEASLDLGTTWYQIARFSQFANANGTKLLTALIDRHSTPAEQTPISGTTIGSGLAVPQQMPWNDRLRIQWVIGGTGGPNFTFAVNCYPFYWG